MSRGYGAIPATTPVATALYVVTGLIVLGAALVAGLNLGRTTLDSMSADLAKLYRELGVYRSGDTPKAEAEPVRTAAEGWPDQLADEIVAWAGLDFSQLDNPDTAEGDTAVCPR